MVFTTHLFLFYFLPVVLLLYYAMPRQGRTGLLAIASYCFYGWANPWWALIMLGSTLIDYVCGLLLVKQAGFAFSAGEQPLIGPEIVRTPAMKATLIASITSNLLLLGYFKYFNFTIANVSALSRALGWGDIGAHAMCVVLPVGISFYTFQSMSYAIDVYRGEARATRNLGDFCCFEALFPQLVAGPVVRYADIAQQLRHRVHSADKFARGVAFFSCGMAKKILLANPMGHLADTAFNAAPASLPWHDAWLGAIAYAFQIYFDFSGYSDMAVGLGLMLGFLFIQNFNSPYQSHSITDFWRRWHISLSTWLRDYLYVPLGGNRKGPSRTYVNLMLVMLIGGLWHGASWTFVAWGALHGGMLAAERSMGKRSPYRILPRPLQVLLTFVIVCIGWVFFRAVDISSAFSYLASMLGRGRPTLAGEVAGGTLLTRYHVVTLLIAAAVVWAFPNSWIVTRRLTVARLAGFGVLLLLSIWMMWTQTSNPFLYFQF